MVFRRTYFLDDPLQVEGLTFATHDYWFWIPEVRYDKERSEVVLYLSEGGREQDCYEVRVCKAKGLTIKTKDDGENNCDVYEWRRIPGRGALELVNNFGVEFVIELDEGAVAVLTWPVDKPIPASLLGYLGGRW